MIKGYYNKSARVVLLASQETVTRYSDLIEHMLTGFNEGMMLVCPRCRSGERLGELAGDMIVHPVVDLPGFGHFNKRILVEKLRRFRPTVIHCLCESEAQLAKRLARTLNIPYVLSVNGFQRRFHRLHISGKRLSHIIVPSEKIRDNVAAFYPRFEDRIVHINYGSFVRSEPVCFSKSRRIAGLVTHFPAVKQTAYENVFGALRHLMIEGYEFQLAVICSEVTESALRKLLEALGLTERSTFVPEFDRWRDILTAADIYVRAKAEDSFEPLLLEAMAVGSAVAACRGGVDDILVDDENCVIIDGDDELSIMASIKVLLDQREQSRKLALAGQEYVRANHSVTSMVSALSEVYEQAEIKKPPAEPEAEKSNVAASS